jgi:hypothetical protein
VISIAGLHLQGTQDIETESTVVFSGPGEGENECVGGNCLKNTEFQCGKMTFLEIDRGQWLHDVYALSAAEMYNWKKEKTVKNWLCLLESRPGPFEQNIMEAVVGCGSDYALNESLPLGGCQAFTQLWDTYQSAAGTDSS